MVVSEKKAWESGKSVDSKAVGNIDDCKEECQDNYECFYAVFDSEKSTNCEMYDKTFISKTSETSSVIEKDCNNKPGEKLFY